MNTVKHHHKDIAGELIPVHILTGFLGSGKTTLLNEILKSEAFENSAVIINEFGEIGLDHHLVETADDAIIELSNGCLCCTVRGQLIETLEALIQHRPQRILIETTGLADPVPVLQALIASPAIKDAIELGGLFTVVDILSAQATIEKHTEANRQVTMADQLIVSKLDQIQAPDRKTKLDALTVKLSALNPVANICTKEQFLGDLTGHFETVFASERNIPTSGEAHHHHHDVNRHNAQISAIQLSHDKPIPRVQIDMFLDLLLSAHGDHVLRLKGLVDIEGINTPMVVQGVGSALSEPYFLNAWPSDERQTKLTVFLNGMDGGFIQRLFHGFLGKPDIDTPDKAALMDNPLAIPGFNLK